MAALAPLALTIVGRGLGRDWLALGEEKGVTAGLPSAVQGVTAVVFLSARRLGDRSGPRHRSRLRGRRGGFDPPQPASTPLRGIPGDRAKVDSWFLVLLMADQVYASADVILISLLLSAGDAGIYAAVYRFPNALITVLGLTVMGLLPGLTRVVTHDSERFAALRSQALRVGAVAAGVVVALIPLAWIAVPLVFGTPYDPGRGPLVLLLIATAFPALTVGLQPLYFAARSERPLALFAVGVATLNLTVNLVVIPRHGLMGAASVTLASQALIAAFYVLGTRPQGATMTGMEPEPVDRCPACGSIGKGLYRGLVDRHYGAPGVCGPRRCNGCRSLWLHPRPTEKSLHLAYVEYDTHGVPTNPPGGEAVKRFLRRLPSHRGRYPGDDRLPRRRAGPGARPWMWGRSDGHHPAERRVGCRRHGPGSSQHRHRLVGRSARCPGGTPSSTCPTTRRRSTP